MKSFGFLSAFVVVASSFAFVACGGSVSGSDTPDGGDSGGDTNEPIDSGPNHDSTPPSDSTPTDAPTDSPVTRTPKQHRPAATTCAPSKPSGFSCGGGGPPPGSCRKDSDCTAGTNGHCDLAGGGVAICQCFYDTCVNDSDCGAGKVCACQGSPYESEANSCAPAGNCVVDSDCGAGGFCSPSGSGGCTNSIGGYFCHVPSDECVDDSDCAGSGSTPPGTCRFDATKAHWACFPMVACA